MIRKIVSALSKTLFPPICNVCGEKLNDYEAHICDNCMAQLPVTNNWYVPHNNVYDRIRKETDIAGALSLFHYMADDRYTNIIRNAKFRNQRQMAYEMGRVMGRYVKHSVAVQGVDFILAVPLHSSRQRWRGYNQSDYIAKGLSEELSIEVLKGVIVRHKKSLTQSRLRGRKKRQENVKGVFRVMDGEILRNKRVLLVDDVITTGATMASCAKEIKKAVPTIEIIVTSLSSTK